MRLFYTVHELILILYSFSDVKNSEFSQKTKFHTLLCEGVIIPVCTYCLQRLSGHSDAVTGIKFDKWHIITCSRDQYALVWSGQGNHDRCLNALRHPK